MRRTAGSRSSPPVPTRSRCGFDATTDCAAPRALCTFASGGVLETGATITVHRTAPTITVSDARAEDGAGATLDFVVSLDAAAAFEIRASATAHDGTATAGADYTAPGGAGAGLVFAPERPRRPCRSRWWRTRSKRATRP